MSCINAIVEILRGYGYGQGGNTSQQGGSQGYGGYSGSDRYGDVEHRVGNNGYGRMDDVEMAPLNGPSGSQNHPENDLTSILNECRDISRAIDDAQSIIDSLKRPQTQILNDPHVDAKSAANLELERLNADASALCSNLVARIRKIKERQSRNSQKTPQIDHIDRRMKTLINQYRVAESDFRKKLEAQIERQYRIVRPDATDEEVRQAAQDTSNQQVFSQALLQSNRSGQANAVRREVEARHQAIQKIEQDMITLAQLYNDLEAEVIQQEPMIENIEQKGEEVTENVGKANEQIASAITSARSRNRKKWWCLLIVRT
ncbi:MAG: Plasma membrane t-SNARE, secretory vesicle fusion [Trizodia sp. TS-e1964]|nr:MAG: Plasma membrane t-SNARE, secretory vesicle fusion [Trizodia sp. TS-e1964]